MVIGDRGNGATKIRAAARHRGDRRHLVAPPQDAPRQGRDTCGAGERGLLIGDVTGKRMASSAERDHLSALVTEVGRPVVHQPAPPFEWVRTRVAGFRPVGYHVR